ncbi:tumor necrosis factor (ligand) superfamily [Mactra antiquata]
MTINLLFRLACIIISSFIMFITPNENSNCDKKLHITTGHSSENVGKISRNNDKCNHRIGEVCLECGEKHLVLRNYLTQVTQDEFERIRAINDATAGDNIKDVNNKQFFETVYWEEKPSAKITGRYRSSNQYTDNYGTEMVAITNWLSEDEFHSKDSFLRNGIRYRNGRLVIPITGTYFIYAFINLRLPRKNNTRHLDDTISTKLGIFRFNMLGIEEELIRKSQNVKRNNDNANLYYFNSYMNSVVDLKSGDEIYIKINDQRFLSNSKFDYFGVHMIER